MNTTAEPRPTAAQWIAGARPRTLPAAISPVLAGSAVAYLEHGFWLAAAVLALAVSLALQIGVNYANDYSDGIRGTDVRRVGPIRLVGSGLARPAVVRNAAFGCFALAALAGLVLVIMTGHWWLLIVGAACIPAAWFYTGGKRPYGYAGLGEVFVFVFFGLVAVCGTTYVQLGRLTLASLLAAIAIGSLACALLVANNLRDIHGDVQAGKHTLATRIGDRQTRILYAALLVVAVAAVVILAMITSWLALLGLVFVLVAARGVITVAKGATGPALIAVLKVTGMAELVCALGLSVGFVFAA